MYLLGIDLGTSSIKICVVNAQTQQTVVSASYPDTEAEIISLQTGWAEQTPEIWWQNTQKAWQKAKQSTDVDISQITAIGISYQMHGLVMIDAQQNVLRNSIIWCDSRAVPYGQKAFDQIGHDKALKHLLNSPGNFTAAKLAWVKENEPEVFEKCDKIMLPGDYLAMKLSGEVATTASGLSEGIFWDFKNNCVSADVLKTFGFDPSIIPTIKESFDVHGQIKPEIAQEWGISTQAIIAYKAGDQPNNALSLNVMNPGEVAATAGTSGVVYAVSEQIQFDPQSRVNTFAHVNHQPGVLNRLGILLCVNGCGIMNAWAKRTFAENLSYDQMNHVAAGVAIGSDGVCVMPFGNGAERMFQNRNAHAGIEGLQLSTHTKDHILRATQEGIAFSLIYGMGVFEECGVKPAKIRAGKANMFLSPIFRETLAGTAQTPIELLDSDGAKGAALGAGLGAKTYKTAQEALGNIEILEVINPNKTQVDQYLKAYEKWTHHLPTH